jgi:hypothetical protein
MAVIPEHLTTEPTTVATITATDTSLGIGAAVEIQQAVGIDMAEIQRAVGIDMVEILVVEVWIRVVVEVWIRVVVEVWIRVVVETQEVAEVAEVETQEVVEVVETKKRAGRQQPPFESSRYEISLGSVLHNPPTRLARTPS